MKILNKFNRTAVCVPFLLLMIAVGCTSQSQTIPSPDGSLVVVTSVEKRKADPKIYLCVIFEIRDRAGKVLHKENTHASDVSKWSIAWLSTNKIQLDSSDIGTYVWEKQSDGTWKKN